MAPRQLIIALAILLISVPTVNPQDGIQFFPLSEVRSGLKGVGRTVFEGNRVEEFQVEVLGVLKNAVAPKRDVILARLSGGPLEKTGVVQGMSGSPVYVDGKLLGAIALSFPFSKEPFAGITPIEEMLRVVPEAGTPPATVPATSLGYRIARTSMDPPGVGRFVPDETDDPLGLLRTALSSSGEVEPWSDLRLPLRFGGFSSQAIEAFAPLFRRLGFEPARGGAFSGDESAPQNEAGLGPGSMISLLLLRGDLNLNADCTVTYRQGNNLYACGHRVFLLGPTQIPFAYARVVATVPNLALSFKLDAPGPVVGTIRQDRFGAIYGAIGESAPLIPVHIQVESTLNKKAEYNFEMVQEPFLSPLLLNIGVVTTLTATERMLGPSALELKGKIQLATGEVVDIEDVVSADINTPASAGAALSLPLSYLLAGGFSELRVKVIDVSIVSRNEKMVATLDQVWATQSEVRPGDHIEVNALLRTPGGETAALKIPVEIPDRVRDKVLTLVVASGSTMNALQSRSSPLNTTPRDLGQFIRNMNRMRRNNKLYALLMSPQRSFILQGDEYPSPPPSLVETLLADPAASSSMIFSGTSVVGDFETKSSPYAIRGQKTLLLRVVGAKS